MCRVLTTSINADLISYTHTFEQELPNPCTMTLVGADTLKAFPAQCQMDVIFVNATSNSGVSRRLLRELYNKNLVFTCKTRNANSSKYYLQIFKNSASIIYEHNILPRPDDLVPFLCNHKDRKCQSIPLPDSRH
jgi:hypothetical protein